MITAENARRKLNEGELFKLIDAIGDRNVKEALEHDYNFAIVETVEIEKAFHQLSRGYIIETLNYYYTSKGYKVGIFSDGKRVRLEW